jgi:hypothetical protein
MVGGVPAIFLMPLITRSYGTILQMMCCIFFLPTNRSAGTDNAMAGISFLPISFSFKRIMNIIRCIFF